MRASASLLICLVTAAGPGAPTYAGEVPAEADSSAAGGYGAYLQIGAHIGIEGSDLDNYHESRYRAFFECGLKWRRPPAPGRTLEGVLIGPSIAGGIASGGGEDFRIGFGPTAVWRLGERWRLHTMAGIARSNQAEGAGLGMQMRGSLVYSDAVAVDCLCYLVPVTVDYGPVREGFVSSLYGGVTFHGRTAVRVTIASVVLGGVFYLLYLWALAAGLSGLN